MDTSGANRSAVRAAGEPRLLAICVCALGNRIRPDRGPNKSARGRVPTSAVRRDAAPGFGEKKYLALKERNRLGVGPANQPLIDV